MSSFLPEPDPILRDRILAEYDPIDTPEKRRWENQYCRHRWDKNLQRQR